MELTPRGLSLGRAVREALLAFRRRWARSRASTRATVSATFTLIVSADAVAASHACVFKRLAKEAPGSPAMSSTFPRRPCPGSSTATRSLFGTNSLRLFACGRFPDTLAHV